MLHPLNGDTTKTRQLSPTPGQILGPYFPLEPDQAADNNLVEWPGSDGLTIGSKMRLYGRIMTGDGNPIANALVEAWQCDANGIYPHPDAPDHHDVDPNFEGYGRFVTKSDGTYTFRALRPVKYPGRAPHLHLKVTANSFIPLVTQMYIAGEIENDDDFALHRIENEYLRTLLVTELLTLRDSSEDYYAHFDIVLERTSGT